MLRLDNEHVVTCATCGEDAIQRQLWAGNRMVSYDTHNRDLASKEHQATFERIRVFHEVLFALQAKLASLPEKDLKLEYGRLAGFEIRSVKPTACETRTDIVPVATVQAFGIRREFELSARPLKGQSVASLLSEFTAEGGIIAPALKAQFDRGDF